MATVTLGKTGITVNKNGFGALPIQRISKEEAARLLRKAFDSGITFFDTAHSYTDSEEKIGYVDALVEGTFCYYAEILSRKPTDPEGLASFFSHELILPDSLTAPVEAGTVIGQVVYTKLDDPRVRISLDCTAGNSLLPVTDTQREQDAASGGWTRYLGWINWILIPLTLYLAWRLLWPYVEKKIHKPKSF